MYEISYMENGFFCFSAYFMHADASLKEVNVNDMISQKMIYSEFTPENASHFPKKGGGYDQ